MPCMRPLTGWRVVNPDKPGKYLITFKGGHPSDRLKLPCGKCIGCLLERSRQWAVRCIHEASLHNQNCFLTLTYDDYHLPPGGSLCKETFVKFMKRLRKRCGSGIRFFQCGEYGEKLKRPHHHVCLFGYDFGDKYVYGKSKSGHFLYRSPMLEELWPFGFCSIGELTKETAGYTARYCLKKLEHRIDEYEGLVPEYVTMSRRPGIGRGYYELYKDDLFNYDVCVVDNGFLCKPPLRYDEWLAVDEPTRYGVVKLGRILAAKDIDEPALDRLMDLEHSLRIRTKSLKRNYEIDSI